MAIGPTGRRLAANVLALRKARGLNQPQLARRMQDQGRAVHATVVSKIEQLDRRVDVDDLVALAIALGVSPNRLLLTAADEGEVELTPELTVHASDAWRWAAGEKPLGEASSPEAEAEARTAFRRENRPDAGDFVLDYGIVIGDREYVVHSVLGNLTAAIRVGLKPDVLHQLIGTATAIANGNGEPKPGLMQQPVIAAIVTSAKGVLVGRRNDGTPPWTFIAGESWPDEDPADTIVREVKEETGLDIRPGEVIGERDHPATHRHMIYMAGRPVRGTRVIVGDEAELAEVRWVSFAEALELLPGMFEPVRDYLARTIGGDR